MKLALHRSITFWFGLLVMGFIGWAGRDSGNCSTSVSYRRLTVTSASGAILLTYYVPDVGSRAHNVEHPLAYGRGPLGEEQRVNAERGPIFARGGDSAQKTAEDLLVQDEEDKLITEFGRLGFADPNSWQLFLPYWTLIVVHMICWLALLFWRARRRRKAIIPKPAQT